MDAVLCTQHASVPAGWRCRDCALAFCSHCIPPNPGVRTADCLCCLRPIERLPFSNLIPPFWQQLPRLIRMPLETDTLLLTLGLALLFGLAGATAPRGLVLVLPGLAIYSLYGTRMMHRVAHGYMVAPVQHLHDRPGVFSLLKQALLFIVLYAAPVAAAVVLHSRIAAIVLLALAVLLTPAAFMTLITTDRLGLALNPVFLVLAALRIGWPYLLFWALLLLISGGSSELHKLLVQMHLSLGAALAVNSLVSIYFGLVTMALMGYVAYQHHEIFGQPVIDPALHGPDGKPARALGPPDRAQLLIAQGKTDEAQTDLEQRLRRQPEQFELHALYQRLLLAKNDLPAARNHAREFVGRLMDARRDEQAWRAYADFVGKFGALEIRQADTIVRLAQQGYQSKQGRLALPLLDKFAQRFPEHQRIPQAWLLTAQILTEEMREDAKGQMILEALVRRYPTSPVREQATRYLALIARLRRSPTQAAPRAV